MICSLQFKKDVLFLKMLLSFGFCTSGFEAIPHLTSIVNKIHHGATSAAFLATPEVSY